MNSPNDTKCDIHRDYCPGGFVHFFNQTDVTVICFGLCSLAFAGFEVF